MAKEKEQEKRGVGWAGNPQRQPLGTASDALLRSPGTDERDSLPGSSPGPRAGSRWRRSAAGANNSPSNGSTNQTGLQAQPHPLSRRSVFVPEEYPPPARLEVGVYGWRKRFLYLLIILITGLVIINAAITLWIVRILDLSLEGMGKIKLHSQGLVLNGDAFIQDDLYATSIRSRMGSALKVQSESNITINGRDDVTQNIVNRLSVTESGVEAIANQLVVRGPDGKLLFLADEDNVIVATDTLRINSEAGIKFNGSIQTPLLQSNLFEALRLESPTRSISIKAPLGVSLESRTGDITATCLQDLTFKSKDGKITLDAPSIELRNLKAALPTNRGKTYPQVYQLCICGFNGRLFMGSPSEPCFFDEKICGHPSIS